MRRKSNYILLCMDCQQFGTMHSSISVCENTVAVTTSAINTIQWSPFSNKTNFLAVLTLNPKVT